MLILQWSQDKEAGPEDACSNGLKVSHPGPSGWDSEELPGA